MLLKTSKSVLIEVKLSRAIEFLLARTNSEKMAGSVQLKFDSYPFLFTCSLSIYPSLSIYSWWEMLWSAFIHTTAAKLPNSVFIRCIYLVARYTQELYVYFMKYINFWTWHSNINLPARYSCTMLFILYLLCCAKKRLVLLYRTPYHPSVKKKSAIKQTANHFTVYIALYRNLWRKKNYINRFNINCRYEFNWNWCKYYCITFNNYLLLF